MTAAERRAYYIKKGVPENEIGPSGYPKVHSVDHPSRKAAEDAAAQKDKGPPMKHPGKAGEPSHFHPTDKDGKKAYPNVHHNYPD